MNKRKQSMIYTWLLSMNMVDTIFDVAGLCHTAFERQEREGAEMCLAAANEVDLSMGSLAASLFRGAAAAGGVSVLSFF
jgi:hypothetical protein